MIHTVKGFGIVNKAEIYVFLELSCFFDDPADVGLISGSSAFSFFCFLNKKFYWRKIEPPRTQGKEHKNSADIELKVTTTQCCLRLLFNFLNVSLLSIIC